MLVEALNAANSGFIRSRGWLIEEVFQIRICGISTCQRKKPKADKRGFNILVTILSITFLAKHRHSLSMDVTPRQTGYGLCLENSQDGKMRAYAEGQGRGRRRVGQITCVRVFLEWRNRGIMILSLKNEDESFLPLSVLCDARPSSVSGRLHPRYRLYNGRGRG